MSGVAPCAPACRRGQSISQSLPQCGAFFASQYFRHFSYKLESHAQQQLVTGYNRMQVFWNREGRDDFLTFGGEGEFGATTEMWALTFPEVAPLHYSHTSDLS